MTMLHPEYNTPVKLHQHWMNNVKVKKKKETDDARGLKIGFKINLPLIC